MDRMGFYFTCTHSCLYMESFILACLMRESATFSKHKIKMLLYLLADGSRHSYWEEPDDASAQALSFPLLTEQTQLLLLLLVQRVTVLGLQGTQIYSCYLLGYLR